MSISQLHSLEMEIAFRLLSVNTEGGSTTDAPISSDLITAAA